MICRAGFGAGDALAWELNCIILRLGIRNSAFSVPSWQMDSSDKEPHRLWLAILPRKRLFTVRPWVHHHYAVHNNKTCALRREARSLQASVPDTVGYCIPVRRDAFLSPRNQRLPRACVRECMQKQAIANSLGCVPIVP